MFQTNQTLLWHRIPFAGATARGARGSVAVGLDLEGCHGAGRIFEMLTALRGMWRLGRLGIPRKEHQEKRAPFLASTCKDYKFSILDFGKKLGNSSFSGDQFFSTGVVR